MELIILLAAGGVFAVLLALNNLIKAITRAQKVGFLDLLLAFTATLIFVTAITLGSLPDAPAAPATRWGLIAAGGIAAASIVTILIELLRPQRLRGSRGLLGLFSALLIALGSVGIPYMGAYMELQQMDADAPAVAVAPTEALPAEVDVTLDATQAENATREARANALGEIVVGLLRDSVSVVAAEIDLSEIEVAQAVDDGVVLATLITENGGSVDEVIEDITPLARQALREAAAQGMLPPAFAALALSQTEFFIRLIVNGDADTLTQRLGGNAPPTLEPGIPTPTPARLVSLFTVTATVEALELPTTRTAEPTEPPTDRPTFTAEPSETREPRETPTPEQTPTPSRTRFVFNTRTPTPTLTPVTPCLAETQYNLRLRAEPDYDAETLDTIPFATTIELYGRGGATEGGAFWWQTRYEGQEGWIDGSFAIIGAACDRLPVLR